MIFATATRFIVRRNAIQKVYWRTVEDESGIRLVKYSKICNFKAKPTEEVMLTQFANNQWCGLHYPTDDADIRVLKLLVMVVKL